MNRIVSRPFTELGGMPASSCLISATRGGGGGGDVFFFGATSARGRFDRLLYLAVDDTDETQLRMF
jgi:hypothetical protein